MLCAWLGVAASFALGLRSAPVAVGVGAWFLSLTASRLVLPWLALLSVVWLVSRPGVRRERRLIRALLVATVFALFLAGGSWLNERVIKPALAVPRPSVAALVDAGALPEGSRAFYALPSVTQRRARLHAVMAAAVGDAAAPKDAHVRAEWGAMVGYSLPSGHAFASMLFATLCFGLARLLRPPGWRFAGWLLAPWAVAVAWSRPLIGVHTPLDVTVGSGLGLALAMIGLWGSQHLLLRSPDAAPQAADAASLSD